MLHYLFSRRFNIVDCIGVSSAVQGVLAERYLYAAIVYGLMLGVSLIGSALLMKGIDNENLR